MAGNVVEYILKINAKTGKAELKNLGKDLKKTQKDLDRTGKRGKKAMRQVAAGAKKAKIAIKAMASGLSLVGIGAAAAGAAIFGLIKGQADYVNQLADTETRTGIAIKTLAGLKLAAEGSGKSFSSMERGLDRFIPKLAEAGQEGSKSAKWFKALGVSVRDSNGDLRDSNGVFNDVISQLSQIEDKTTKNAYAFEIFGQSAGAALLQSGAIEGMDKFIDRAESLGPALDENGIKKAAEFQRGWADLKTSIMGITGDIVKGITGESGIGKGMSVLASDMKYYAKGIVEWFKWIGESFQPIIDGMVIAAEMLEGKWKMPSVKGVTEAPLSPGYGKLKVVDSTSAIPSDVIAEEVFGGSFLEKAKKKELKLLSMWKETIDTGEKTDDEVLESLERYKKRPKIKSKIKQIYKDQAQRLLMQEHRDKIPLENSRFDELFGKHVTRKEASSTGGGLKLIPVPKKKKKPQRDFKLPVFGEDTKDIVEQIEKTEVLFDAFERLADIIPQLNDEYSELEAGIADGSISLSDASARADELKTSWEDLGYKSDSIDPLIDKISELAIEADKAAAAAKRLSDAEFGINLATRFVDLAGGDIAGGIAGITGMLAPSLGPIAGAGAGLASGIANLGTMLISAEKEAMKSHLDGLVSKQEELLGRGLSDEEIKAIEQGITSSDKEQITDDARRAAIENQVEAFTMALSVGIQELPRILLEILPPMLFNLATNIIDALLTLPGNIVKSVVLGLAQLFANLVEAIKNMISNIPGVEEVGKLISGVGKVVGTFVDIVTMPFERDGGRFVSARSGIRFTGGSDGLAMLHRNEFVVPESGSRPQAINRMMNEGGGGSVIVNINADIVERGAVEELVRKMERSFLDFGTAKSTLFG